MTDADSLEGLPLPRQRGGRALLVQAPPGTANQTEDTISLTLLKAVQVLAVEGRTILTTDEPASAPASSSRGLQRQMVTLMITPKQAELLQLAQKFGSISLAMRNPLDSETPAAGETLLSQVSEFFRRRAAAAAAPAPVVATPVPGPAPRVEPPAARPPPATKPAPAPTWTMTFIRGGTTSDESFPDSSKARASTMNTHILDFHASGHGSRGGFDPHPLWPILILLTVALAALAQSPPPSETPWSSDKGMSVMMGQSAVVHAPWPVKRVAMTDIRVADVKGLSAQRLLVISKAIGTTDLTIWNEKEEMLRMQVEVTADVEWLRRELVRGCHNRRWRCGSRTT